MSEKGTQQTSLVTEYRFIQEELAILDPLQRRKKQIEEEIGHFVTKKVIPRLGVTSPNQKYRVTFDIDKNSIRIKRMENYLPVDRHTWRDVVGSGKATRAR